MHICFWGTRGSIAKAGRLHTGVRLWLFGIFASCPFSEFRTVGLSAALVLVPLSIAALLYPSLLEILGPMK